MTVPKPKILIIGGGFAGLNAACQLGRMEYPVTIVDRQNFHLFQPLLYQIATGFLTPGDIATPLRSVLSPYKTVKILQDEIRTIDAAEKKATGNFGTYSYDILIVAGGVCSSYFGNEDWLNLTTGLKTVEDSLKLRSRILRAFEAAERTSDEEERKKLLTFCVIGGGPTGVEVAGALIELSKATLRDEFRNFDPSTCKVILFEGSETVLSNFHKKISRYAEKTLTKLGVELHTNTYVKNIQKDYIEYEKKGGTRVGLPARTIIWAAGVKASPLADEVKKATNAETDRAGRIIVKEDLSIAGHDNIYVLGDMANAKGKDGKPLPGLAPVAMQQGNYVAKLIDRKFNGKQTSPFSYFDKGNMAVIGKGRAVAETGLLRLTGFPAWFAWAFIHIYFLIEFENKIIVFLRWAWNYITNRRGSRLITLNES